MRNIKQLFNSPINVPGVSIPSTFRVVKKNEQLIEAVRPDGLHVFFDRKRDDLSQFLNYVRVHGTTDDVVMAVGMVRGFQISLNYAERYSPETIKLIEEHIKITLGFKKQPILL